MGILRINNGTITREFNASDPDGEFILFWSPGPNSFDVNNPLL